MFEDLRRSRQAKRVKPGDGRALQRFRWWQLPGRALFSVRLPHADGRQRVYAVDIRHWLNQSSGETRAHLFVDGRHHAESRIPAAFPVPGGVVEVAMSGFGMTRCHYVTAEGEEHQLEPDPRSAEGRRARLDRERPALSRGAGFCSLIMLTVGVALLLMQVIEPVSQIPQVAERTGSWQSPVQLPWWLNLTLGLGAAAGSMERGLRLRYHWLLDGAAN